MSSESQAPSSASEPGQAPPPTPEQLQDDESKSVSKKAAKKEAAKQEKLRRRQEATIAAAASSLSVEEEDPLSSNYGDKTLTESPFELNDWVHVKSLTPELEGQSVVLNGRAQTIRAVGKNMAFVVLRESGCTVQCVVTVQPDAVSRQMVKYVASLNRESMVDIQGFVTVPSVPIKGATQQVRGNQFNVITSFFDILH